MMAMFWLLMGIKIGNLRLFNQFAIKESMILDLPIPEDKEREFQLTRFSNFGILSESAQVVPRPGIDDDG